ncbi:MAG: hypothetical protein AAF741_00600 [Bacteroidota bacterium]
MRFSDLVHIPSSLKQLAEMADDDRLPHANLLQAPAGTGGLPAALALASYLLCENRTGGDSCGECKACRKSYQWVHPDLHFAFPTVGTRVTSDTFLKEWRAALKDQSYQEINDWLQRIGAENKQGNLNKEECVAIAKKLSLKIYEGRYKIMLIWLPEYLGNEGNRLLKLIEEPPERTVFLLVTQRPERILNTILSRCQLTKLGRPNEEHLLDWLVRKGMSQDAAERAARLSGGNVNRALRLGKTEQGGHEKRFLEWMRVCHSGSPTKLVAWNDEFSKLGRENQKEFLAYALHYWREFMRLAVGATPAEGLSLGPAEVQTAQKMTAVVSLSQLQEIVAETEGMIEHVERNAHPKILAMKVGLKLHEIMRN